MRLVRIMTGIGLLLFAIGIAAIQWPIRRSGQPAINEARIFDHGIGGYQGVNAFHGGVDIPATAGTPVYPVIAGESIMGRAQHAHWERRPPSQ